MCVEIVESFRVNVQGIEGKEENRKKRKKRKEEVE
jgi:hypothetical protein